MRMQSKPRAGNEVPARWCRVKVALRHTYITLPQVTSRIAGLRKLRQEGKTKVFVTFLKQKKVH